VPSEILHLAAPCRLVPVTFTLDCIAMPPLLDHLAKYVSILERSAASTRRAEDRLAYSRHLAAAARMFRAAHLGALPDLNDIVAEERRAFGQGYLSDAEGEAAEKAFAGFAATVEGQNAI